MNAKQDNIPTLPILPPEILCKIVYEYGDLRDYFNLRLTHPQFYNTLLRITYCTVPLLKNKYIQNVRDNKMSILLTLYCKYNCISFIERSLEYRNPIQIYFKCHHGRYLNKIYKFIDYAIYTNNKHCIWQLLFDGTLTKYNYNYHKIILWACKYGHLDIVKWILKHSNVKINMGYHKNIPMKLASRYGHIEIVRYLLKLAKVDKKIRPTSGDHHPVRLSAKNGHIDITELLLKYIVELKYSNIDIDDIIKKTIINIFRGHYRGCARIRIFERLLECNFIDMQKYVQYIFRYALEYNTPYVIGALLDDDTSQIESMITYPPINNNYDPNRNIIVYALFHANVYLIDRILRHPKLYIHSSGYGGMFRNAIWMDERICFPGISNKCELLSIISIHCKTTSYKSSTCMIVYWFVVFAEVSHIKNKSLHLIKKV